MTEAEINDVMLVIVLSVMVYLGSGFISVILKFISGMIVILGVVTILHQYGLYN